MKKCNILLLSAHPAIDSELATSWTEMGHKVYLYSRSVKWDDRIGFVPEHVSKGLPSERPDVIFCGIKWDASFALKLKLKKLWFKSPIVMIHWWFPNRAPSSYVHYFVKNVSVCRYGQRYLRRLLGINSPVVYCPVDTDFFQPKFEQQGKIALIIGNMFKERNIMGYPYLIDILKRVHDLEPDIRLVVMGDNTPSDFPEYVEYILCNKSEMLPYLHKASCVFFTTTKNLIMHSMEISMSCGKNVVAFDLPSFHEVITEEESGYLIPPFNTNLFAEKIVEVTNSPSAKVGEKAREIIVEKCDRRKVAKQLLEVVGL
jgi:glycosyltransferase involved in cell wall biosynthesis